MEERAQLRRVLSWTLIVTLCIAALTAIGAILSGDFDDTDARVIGTSIGFAVFSSTAASGGSLRYRQDESLRSLGLVTIVLSGIAFLLLAIAIWEGFDADGDEPWQWFGVVALAAFAASHASLVLGARRDSDSDGLVMLATASIGFGILDSSLGILAIAEVFEADDESARVLAVLLVLFVLTTVLQPIVRRLQRTESQREEAPAPMLTPFAAEVIAAVERIEALNADPGNRGPEIRRECERLRKLARARGD